MSTLTFRPFPAGSGGGAPRPRTSQREDPSTRKREPSKSRSKGRPSTKTLQQVAPGSYRVVWLATVMLVVLGICMLLSIFMAQGVQSEGEAGSLGVYRNLIFQSGVAVVGLSVLFLARRFDYRKLRKFSMAIMALTVITLLLVHIPGVGSVRNGARSYISLGPISFQPSEFAKLAVVIVGAHILSSKRVRDGRMRSYVLPFGIWGLVLFGLLVWENDYGTGAIIIGLVLGMLWLAGMKTKDWWILAGGGAVAGGGAMLLLGGSKIYGRLIAVVDPTADPTGKGYQLRQSLLALGRGGWFGVGPGRSVQKFNYLPEAHNDMIFAILGEELGFLGASVAIALFIALAVGSLRLARRCADPMGKYLIAGCGMIIVLQAAVNIGGVVGAIPLTGVPLPFVSHGCNSLIVMLAAIGLILAVAGRAAPTASTSPAKRKQDVMRTDSRRGDGGARSARASAG